MTKIKNNFKTFLGKRLLFFTAHPDDESYVMAGTIYKNYQLGGKNFLICASNGERGFSHLENRSSGRPLKKVRQKELLTAARLLHLAPVIFLNLPDGKLKVNSDKIFRRGLALARRLWPEAIVSFAGDGISGHLDHIAVGRVARLIAKRRRIPFFAATLPPRVVGAASQVTEGKRLLPQNN